ncbi:MAG: hypothetical protein QXJ72_05590 [Thermoproteota archaeon]
MNSKKLAGLAGAGGQAPVLGKGAGATPKSPENNELKIRKLFIEPPNSMIPELMRFRSAPYKFERLTVSYSCCSNKHDIVFKNKNAIISTRFRIIVFKTRTHGHLYQLDLAPWDFPKELGYYVGDVIPNVVVPSFWTLVKEWASSFQNTQDATVETV